MLRGFREKRPTRGFFVIPISHPIRPIPLYLSPQGLTIDSRKSDAAPPRVILGEVVHDVKAYYDNLRNQQDNQDNEDRSEL